MLQHILRRPIGFGGPSFPIGFPGSPSMQLLGKEPEGMASDFTVEGGSVSVLDRTTPANNLRNVRARDWWTQSGTSPKLVRALDGTYRWSPHNLCLRSEEVDNASWTKTGVTATANQAAAPSGATTMDLITEDSSNGDHIASITAASLVSGFPYAASVVLRRGTKRYAMVALTNTAFSTVHAVGVDLLLGQLVASGQGSAQGITLTPLGTDLYRVSFWATANASGTGSISVYMSNDGLWANRSYQGDGAATMYIWGAQLNNGTVPTDYLLTTSAAAYTLAQDYDPTHGWGLLVEPAATNLNVQSTALNNASWTKTDVTVSENNAVAPNGLLNAALITEGSAGTAAHRQDVTVSSGAVVVHSRHVKRGNHDWYRLHIANAANAADFYQCYFNISTGVVGTANTGGNGTGVSGYIIPIGNGWYRCVVVGALTGATSYRVFSLSANGNGGIRVAGGTRYEWQPDTAINVLSSPIPTAAATVTRARDSISKASSNIPGDGTKWTIYLDAVYPSVIRTTTQILTSLHGVSGEAIAFYVINANTHAFVADGGVTQMDQNSLNTHVVSTRIQASHAVEANNCAKSMNGDAVSTDAGVTMPTIDTIELGRRDASDGAPLAEPLHIRRIAVVPRRVSNAELPTWRYAA